MNSYAPWAAAGAGLLFGSFLNVCIARLPRHASIVFPGSHCPRCRAPLRAADNIPLLSFLLLRGRCRACRQRISIRYPLVEAALAILWFACAARFGVTAAAADAAVFCFLALGLLVTDLETFLLPNSLTLPGLALGVAAAAVPGWTLIAALALPGARRLPALAESLVAAAAAGAVLLLVRGLYRLLRRREGLGLGDVKLAAMLGAWLGLPGVALALVLGVLAGGLAGTAILLRRSGGGLTRLPLGTALCAGALGALFFGGPLLHWYLGLFR